ncbi:spore germination protein [Cohnella sp.]|uniref:spore germination protein n=1 Tax=Cohnella sp. TaxID=1883426 RepID=UPI003561CBB8
MPCIVGNVKILSIGSSGVVQFGDALQISPTSTSKTYAGSGSFLTGDLSRSNNAVSATNTYDKDLQDASPNEITGTEVIG